MCGVTGFWAPGRMGQSLGIVKAMADALRHRGPDDSGSWVDPQVGLALGHRRLAIIELSPRGAQPMHSHCGRYVIVFNGEIYNHFELRRELAPSNMAPDWRGNSDTETLLAGIGAWGLEKTLRRAVGMFAVALWDRRDKTLTLARDRFGEKPLYYAWLGSGEQSTFLFGSELKALQRFPGFDPEIDRGSLDLFLRFCTVPAPHTIYRNVFKLKPGTIATLDESCFATRRIDVSKYWNLGDVARQGSRHPIANEAEAIDLLEAALTSAVSLQMIADVPLGAFLSGGIDSSTVVALMQANSSRPVKTFTVGFDEAAFDEAPAAAAVASHLGTDHNELRVSPADTLNVISQLPRIYDEPFGDSSQIPTALICAAARRGVTVALTGDGGDEMFGGYNRYFWPQAVWSKFERVPAIFRQSTGALAAQVPTALWDRLGKLPAGSTAAAGFGDKVHRLAHRLRHVQNSSDLYESLVSEWYGSDPPVRAATIKGTILDDASLVAGIEAPEERMMIWDGMSYLPDDILTKVDRAAMSVSLETRLPMLDHRVAEVAWRLPLSMKLRNGKGKWALRKVLQRYVPPALTDRPKAGFGIPVGLWLRGPLRDWAESLLDERRLRSESYLEADTIRLLWAQHLSGRRDWTFRLWNILMFQAWLTSVRS